MSIRSAARVVLGSMLAMEGVTALARHGRRHRLFDDAAARACKLRRPLIVVGDPDAGLHTRLMRAYGCGDVCVDLHGCPLCPVFKVADITAGLIEGLADDSGVVFVSCVLEYVQDPEAAVREILRIAGSPENVYLVTVEPWTFTAALYPGARWAAVARSNALVMVPITGRKKAIAAGILGGAVLLSLLPGSRGSTDGK